MGIAMFCFDEMVNAIAGILMMLLYIMTRHCPLWHGVLRMDQ